MQQSPYNQISEFVQYLHQENGVSPKAFEFAILTACRSSEIFDANGKKLILEIKSGLFQKNG